MNKSGKLPIMFSQIFSRSLNSHKPSIRLENGSCIAVMGGGPAGSFFSYFLLDLAGRMDLNLKVDIYEPRDFSLPAPQGCNMCAGVISETLVQNLAMEGIHIPPSVLQKAVNAYVLHTDAGCQQINAAYNEKRIGVMFRGAGPRSTQKGQYQSFDGYLLSLARDKGANVLSLRVTDVKKSDENVQIVTRSTVASYDLLVVAAGVNTGSLKLLEQGLAQYRSPATTKTAVREYYLGRKTVEKTFGDSLHVFLLDIPKLDFGMILPKGDFVTICLLGKDIDENLIQSFLTAPEVKSRFPEGWHWDQPVCQCQPRINVQAAVHPFIDRVVFIGDSGVTRLYKDGIGAAYRAAKAAATCAVLEGISSEDFRRFYAPFCKEMAADNQYGRFIFLATHVIKRVHFFRRLLLRIIATEQRSSGICRCMSEILWDTFTGSAPYRDVFLRTLHPRIAMELLSSLANSVVGG